MATRPARYAWINRARKARAVVTGSMAAFAPGWETPGHGAAQAHLGEMLRAFFDPQNKALGIFLALKTPDARAGTHPMLRSDVARRVQDRYKQLLPLHEPARRNRFI